MAKEVASLRREVRKLKQVPALLRSSQKGLSKTGSAILAVERGFQSQFRYDLMV